MRTFTLRAHLEKTFCMEDEVKPQSVALRMCRTSSDAVVFTYWSGKALLCAEERKAAPS